nr:ABC transporter ATP-binding protein [uncultured Lachnoclostridium sp.]
MNKQKKFNTKSNIRWLTSHIFQYPVITIIFITVVFLSIYYQNNVSIYIGKIFDAVSSRDRQEVGRCLFLLFLVSVGQGLLDLFSSYSILALRLNVEKDTRQEIYEDLLQKDQSIYDETSTGNIMALATNEIRNISIMFQPGFLITYKSILSYVIPICFILRNFHYSLSIGPILFTILSLYLLLRYSKNINTITKDVRQKFGQMNSSLNEVMEGIEVVKANAQEDKEKAEFKAHTNDILTASLKRVKVEAGYKPTLVFALFFGVAVFQALSIYVKGDMSLGSLVSYITIYMNLKYPISNAEISFSLIGQGMASVGRIVEILKQSKTIENSKNPVKEEIKGGIEFSNVSFGYKKGKDVLKDLNFSIQPGETVAIVGSTGSGKSTVTKLLNRTYDIDKGQILIDGHDIKEWDLKTLRSSIGVIEQDVFLFSWSILKNIAFGSGNLEAEGEKDAIELCAKKSYAHNFIEEFPDKYDTMVGERGIQLSGGQRQRIAIARALLMNPKILVLDDSTSAVDSKTEEEIQKGLKNIMKERTTILITHRLSQIIWADKIIMMKNGRILAKGSHKQLMKECKEYRDMYSEYL